MELLLVAAGVPGGRIPMSIVAVVPYDLTSGERFEEVKGGEVGINEPTAATVFSTTRELPVQFGKWKERTVSRTVASTSNKRSRLGGPYFL